MPSSLRGALQRPQRVESQPRGVELAGERGAPRTRGVERRVLDAAEIGRQLDAVLVERAYAVAAEGREREAELEDHVLARARSEMPAVLREPADVVGGHDHHCERARGLRLELLDQGPPARCLLAEQDRLEAELH